MKRLTIVADVDDDSRRDSLEEDFIKQVGYTIDGLGENMRIKVIRATVEDLSPPTGYTHDLLTGKQHQM